MNYNRTILLCLVFLLFTASCAAKTLNLKYEENTTYLTELTIEEQKLAIEKRIYKKLLNDIESQYGTAITSYSEVRNFVMVEDIIAKSTSVGVKIKAKKHDLIERSGKVMIFSSIAFVVDTDKIVQYRPDLERLHKAEEALRLEREQNKKLNADLEEQKTINSMLDYAPGETSQEEFSWLQTVIEPLLRGKQANIAKTQLEDHMTRVPSPEWAYYYGRALMELKLYQHAYKNFELAYSLKPTARYLKSKGDVLFLMGQYDSARTVYEQVLKIKRNSAATWANLGACLWYLDYVPSAIEAYDKACEIGGCPRAETIRASLEGQYIPYHANKPGSGKRTKYARQVLPLC